jgi:hypothetical protein
MAILKQNSVYFEMHLLEVGLLLFFGSCAAIGAGLFIPLQRAREGAVAGIGVAILLLVLVVLILLSSPHVH